MEKDELKELEDYYNNVLLLGGTSFVYDCFEITKTKDGKWKLIKFLGDDYKKPFKIIPDFIQIIGVTAFYYHRRHFSNFIIPEGVERIEFQAFRECTFGTLKLPNTLKEICSQAFTFCDVKDGIYIPDNVERIGADAFYNNRNLKSLSLPTGVLLEEYAFGYCGCYYTTDEVTFEVRKTKGELPYIITREDTFSNSVFKQLAEDYER
jgi:hypothetical protein